MSEERRPNPRGPTPSAYDGKLSEPVAVGPCNFIEGLGECVDSIRQIASDLGARPYTVHSVTITWSGGEIGRGAPTVTGDQAILPTPLVRQVSSMQRDPSNAGSIERGDVILTGVSPRYTEDEIEELFGVDEQDGVERFVEVRIDSRDGEPKRRRFVLGAPPERRPTFADWRIKLTRQDSDRRRDGSRREARERVWR